MAPAVSNQLHCLTIGLALTGAAAAQSAGLRGVVYDKDYDVPLAGVTVTIVGGPSVKTGDQGNYRFPSVEPGTYTVVFTKEGYLRQLRNGVLVTARQLRELDMRLPNDFVEEPEMIVEDSLQLGTGSEAALLQLRFESPSLVDSISSELLSRAGASDAAAALRLVSGATVQDGKSAVIRGLPDRYVSSKLNGLRLPSADNDKRAVELDQFPSAVIESIQVSKTFTPDQQGDASGGAVDVRLRGIPEESFVLRVRGQRGWNSQAHGRDSFLSYQGGGITALGRDNGSRDIQTDNLGGNWDGAVGVSEREAPTDFKWAVSAGGSYEFDNRVRVGGFADFFYERDSSFVNDAFDNSYWVDNPGQPLVPRTTQGGPSGGDFRTALFDVVRATQTVQWGSLASFGIETDNNKLSFYYLYSRTTDDEATLLEDTRAKPFFFPGYDPNDPTTPGHEEPLAAPFLRTETLQYQERTTGTLQLSGQHTIPVDDRDSIFKAPQIDWAVAQSFARSNTPDKRQFGTAFIPERMAGGITVPPTQFPFKPGANFTLGQLQRIYERIQEESQQYYLDLKLPFEQWTRSEGYLKFGAFHDELNRSFDQETFSNFEDNTTFNGRFDQLWSASFPFENHPITESQFDVDYTGNQEIAAWYGMIDLPVTSYMNLITGVRFEDTEISIINDPEPNATWFPPGALTLNELNPGDADVAIAQNDALPSVGLVIEPHDDWTVRASYSETIARQTFKELTPILQQEFLGGPIFIGNPDLQISDVENWDVRVDYTPYEGGLWSASWFRKDLTNPIEVVQRPAASFDFNTPVNFPSGRLEGWELETRQDLGYFVDAFEGFSIGANATFIESEVLISEQEQVMLAMPNVNAPATRRDATGAPSYLYNLFATYDVPVSGTQLSAFYTVQGDTLVAGAGVANGNLVPDLYADDFEQLNLSVRQPIASWFNVRFQAKNVTNPEIRTYYDSDYIPSRQTKTSTTRGIDYSFSIGGEISF